MYILCRVSTTVYILLCNEVREGKDILTYSVPFSNDPLIHIHRMFRTSQILLAKVMDMSSKCIGRPTLLLQQTTFFRERNTTGFISRPSCSFEGGSYCGQFRGRIIADTSLQDQLEVERRTRTKFQNYMFHNSGISW